MEQGWATIWDPPRTIGQLSGSIRNIDNIPFPRHETPTLTGKQGFRSTMAGRNKGGHDRAAYPCFVYNLVDYLGRLPTLSSL